ncbi:DNA-binding response regulator [Enterococcus florum]|uniref:DNA-binding response regulator n=1 Tax=Enterococcus florum TaxID=2480627 RepID=A0A4P5PGV6_9ENTE|nr:response regulator transcription factor [Enterococcus florum]GCF95548.1 DNA-binding response regulator [Enterococcus florum]
MMKLFLVEDDPTIVEIVQKHLEQWDYECLIPADFQRVDEEIKQEKPDLVILDISLPFFNGFHWCQKIREFSEVPILFLSSAEDKMNQVMAMTMGADDFIPKPFDLTLLLAKIQAILRRSYQYGHHETTYELGEFTFFPTENLLRNAQTTVPISPNEARILQLLCQYKGSIVPRESIIEMLWQNDEFIDNNTLAVNLTRLRKKLAAGGLPDLIHTVKNKGYLIEGDY